MMIRTIAKMISGLSLAGLLVPPILFLTGSWTSLETVKQWMLAATIAWFVSASLWMWNEKKP